MKKILSLLFLVSGYFMLAAPVSAVYFGSGDNLYLSPDKKFTETVFVSGSKIVIDSDINGDLFCAGRDITINGKITGDIFCAGQSLKINAPVDGNVRIAGQTITLDTSVTKNVLAAGQDISLTGKSSVKGDAFAAGQSIVVSGPVSRDVGLVGANVTLESIVGRDAHLAGGHLTVTPNAKVGGNLNYYVDDTSVTDFADGVIAGESTKHLTHFNSGTKSVDVKKAQQEISGGIQVYSILAAILLGLVLLYIQKSFTLKAAKTISSKPLISFLIGLAVLIVTPFVFLFLLITLFGVPLAFVVLFLYIIGLITASVYSSLAFGRWLLTLTKIGGSDYLAMLLGIIAVRLLGYIPGLGFFVGSIIFCLGLGSFFTNFLPAQNAKN